LEVLRYDGLTEHQRDRIVTYCRGQLGKPFAELGWRYDVLTYAFGVPSALQDPEKASCHGLAFQAYEQAGIFFPHQLAGTPIFNLARYLGRPLGHPADRADSRRLYLRDHHLYRDNRFTSVLAAFDDPETGDLQVTENPGKYSWSVDLQQAYGQRRGGG
jgi:hypothetical protein